MFSPVGSRPPSVYWRRRIILLGSLVLLVALVALTVRAIAEGDDGNAQAGGSTPASSTASSTTPATRKPTMSVKPASTRTVKSSKASPPRSRSTAPLPRCRPGNLAVRAVVAKTSYDVGDQPMLELQVTNNGTRPCVQDLADRQIELKVYNGESRVWGSHDCEIQDGTSDRTLAVGRAVRVSITWSGLTSQKGCKGTRQRVGAGTYTLYALLSGKTGKATQFSIG